MRGPRRDHQEEYILSANVEDDIVVAMANGDSDEVMEIVESFIKEKLKS